MSFEIFVNGEPLDLWERATVKRDLDSNCGTFSFTTSSTVPPAEKYPVVPGDLVYVHVDGDSKIHGFVDNISSRQSDTNHLIDVRGRDNIQDLIDSSVPDSAKVLEGPLSLKDLCIKFINGLEADIPVVSNVKDLLPFTTTDLQASEFGGTCMVELVSFARKRQVYLVSDGNGRLVIYRPQESIKASGSLIHRANDKTNNVKSYALKISDQKRFYEYVCRSQDNFGFDVLSSWTREHPEDAVVNDGTDRNGSVVDKDIRKSRFLEIQAEVSMNDTECAERASEEANLRRGLSQQYACVVAGHTQIDGTPWDIGQFVNIEDEFAAVSGELLIKAVSYSMDKRRGSKTKLVCVPPDTYQVIADPTATTKRRARLGYAFQAFDKSTQIRTSPRRDLSSFYDVKF